MSDIEYYFAINWFYHIIAELCKDDKDDLSLTVTLSPRSV